MKQFRLLFLSLVVGLAACSPVKLPVTNQYQLSAFSAKKLTSKPRVNSLLVTAPETVAGYQTEQMRYIKTPYKLDAFAKNAWTSPPGDMLYSLLVQSLQKSQAFTAVTSGSYSDVTDYRLDTQLLALQQNFLKKPSVLEFTAKVVLTRPSDNKIVGSQLINLSIPCQQDTPYGGVVAANIAVRQFTAIVVDFVGSRIVSSPKAKKA